MKIALVVICYNERMIMPWVVDYWKLYADKVIVYDNGSNVGSIEYLQQFGDWIDIRHFSTKGQDNGKIRDIKNKVWKELKDDYDWLVISDFDEMIYCPEGLKNALQRYSEASVGLIYPQWYVLSSDEIPVYDGKLFHQIRPMWTFQPKEAKPLIFCPKYFKEMNFSAGQHKCNPIANVPCKTIHAPDIYCLHTEGRLSQKYWMDKMHWRAERRSQNDRNNGYGIHYGKPDEKLIQNWNEIKQNAVKLEI